MIKENDRVDKYDMSEIQFEKGTLAQHALITLKKIVAS